MLTNDEALSQAKAINSKALNKLLACLGAAFKFLRWAFWNCWYKAVGRSSDLKTYIRQGERCRWPWWKFKPCVYHNDEGRQWDVWFEDEDCYATSEEISVKIHRAQSDSRVVGITVWDEKLRPLHGPDHAVVPFEK